MLAQRQRLGLPVSSAVSFSLCLSLLSILTQCFSALNAASPGTQTSSQGPEASSLLPVEQQPEAE